MKPFSLRLLFLLSVGACGLVARAAENDPEGIYADFFTPRGTVEVRLAFREAPLTVANFVGLAEGTLAPRNGKPFYTGLTWYRVVPGFVIQSGDPEPEKSKGKDDAGIPHTFPDELVPGLHHGKLGVLSMANGGPDTNSCEFFLTLGDDTRLNYLHSVFGEVVRGAEILPQIQANEPFTISIRRVGAAARAFKADEATFRTLTAKTKRYAGPAAPGPDAFFDDPDKLIPTEPPRAKNFNFKLANFERVTGIKVVARLFAHSPAAAEDSVPGAYMRSLAEKLGVARDGVLVAYFHDEKDWRFWVGDALTDRFLGRKATADDLKEDGPLHDVKTKVLDQAQAAGDAVFAAQEKAGPPPAPGQRVKLQTDALLDALLLRLEPKS